MTEHPMKHKVFISYSHADGDFAFRLAQDLRRNNVDVAMDEREVHVGDSIVDRLGALIDQSEFVCIVISKAALASEWVKKELEIALHNQLTGRGTKVLPVLIENCPLPPELRAIRQADFTAHKDTELYVQRFQDLLRAINKRPAKDAGGGTILHRATVLTGLTSSGKDSLLTDIYRERISREESFFFLKKVMSRPPNNDEHPLGREGQRLVPYIVEQVDRGFLEENRGERYFSLYYRYGYYFGFERAELENVLLSRKPSSAIFIQPDIPKLPQYRSELERICDEIQDAAAQNGKDGEKIAIKVSCVLVDCDVDACLDRLIRRGLLPQDKMRREAKIKDDAEHLAELNGIGFFDRVVDNSNANPYNAAKASMIEFLVGDGGSLPNQ